MRSRHIVLTASIVAALATPAAAQLNLAWDDCGLAGTELKTWACDANPTVVARFYASFVVTPAMSITALAGAQGYFDLWTSGTAVPAWWQFQQVGACRPNGLAVDVNLPCASARDYFNTVSYPVGGFSYTWGPFVPGHARLETAQAIPIDAAGPVGPGEFYAVTVTLKGTRTTGTGSCAGCTEPMGIVFNQFVLVQPTGAGDVILTGGSDRNWVDWQCPGSPFLSMPPGYEGFRFYCETPAHPKTWGQIKALYR